MSKIKIADSKKALTREIFMQETGVFVSHIYFDITTKSNYEESNLPPKEFCKQWLKNEKDMIYESSNIPNFKFILDDEEISCLENEDIDPDNIKATDIIENLSEQNYWLQQKSNEVCKYAEEIKNIYKETKKYYDELMTAFNDYKKDSNKVIDLNRFGWLFNEFNYNQLIKKYNHLVSITNDFDGEHNEHNEEYESNDDNKWQMRLE